MKNLIGYLKKIAFLSSFLLLLLPISKVNAEANFQVTTDFNHTISDDSKIYTSATVEITTDEATVLTYYTASIPITDLDARCYLVSTNEELTCTIYHKGSNTDVLINLKSAVITPESPITVRIEYSTSYTDTSTFSITSQILDSTTKSIKVAYPQSYGEPLWTSVPIQNLKLADTNYQLTFTNPTDSQISLLFGKQVAYAFSASRVFSNTNNDNPQTFELILPPDTQSQIIVWSDISPLPTTAIMDESGNYVFNYVVPANETVDCKISGYVVMEKSVQQSQAEFSSYLTKESGYWSITDSSEEKRVISFIQGKGLQIGDDFSDITTLDKAQMGFFYKYLYQYVINRLNFSSDIKLGITAYSRLGANAILGNSNGANAQDYADFYIALLRKYNIPARMVIGYVSNSSGYTSDGFYHYWVEYYDYTNEKWVTVDPFLEEYLGFSFYGTELYDHIVLLRREKSPLSPTLTFYDENDFTVAFDSEAVIEPVFDVESELVFDNYDITHKYSKGYIYLSNVGNVAITNYSISSSSFGDFTDYLDVIGNIQSQIVLPKESVTIQANVPYDVITTRNAFVQITYANLNSGEEAFTLETELSEGTPLQMTLLGKILSITVFSIVLLLVYLLANKFIKRRKKDE